MGETKIEWSEAFIFHTIVEWNTQQDYGEKRDGTLSTKTC
jgi:hypothetical protein